MLELSKNLITYGWLFGSLSKTVISGMLDSLTNFSKASPSKSWIATEEKIKQTGPPIYVINKVKSFFLLYLGINKQFIEWFEQPDYRSCHRLSARKKLGIRGVSKIIVRAQFLSSSQERIKLGA